MTSKHRSKEVNFNDKTKIKTQFCSSCNTAGHCLTECPKDPNVRSKYSVEEEIERISMNWNLKEKLEQANHQFTLQKRMLDLMGNAPNTVDYDCADSDIVINN